MPTYAHRLNPLQYFTQHEQHLMHLMLAMLNETRRQLTPPLAPLTHADLTEMLRHLLRPRPTSEGG